MNGKNKLKFGNDISDQLEICTNDIPSDVYWNKITIYYYYRTQPFRITLKMMQKTKKKKKELKTMEWIGTHQQANFNFMCLSILLWIFMCAQCPYRIWPLQPYKVLLLNSFQEGQIWKFTIANINPNQFKLQGVWFVACYYQLHCV